MDGADGPTLVVPVDDRSDDESCAMPPHQSAKALDVLVIEDDEGNAAADRLVRALDALFVEKGLLTPAEVRAEFARPETPGLQLGQISSSEFSNPRIECRFNLPPPSCWTSTRPDLGAVTVPKTALYTFGILKDSYTSATLRDFAATAPAIFAELAAADGFVSHAGDARPDLRGKSEIGQGYGPWGIYVVPRFYSKDIEASGFSMIQTLSLWRDLEAAHRFSYGALHRAALKRRADWFRPHECPGYVLWWVSDDAIPTWTDGVARIEALADRGSSAFGFDFKDCFDANCLSGRISPRREIMR